MSGLVACIFTAFFEQIQELITNTAKKAPIPITTWIDERIDKVGNTLNIYNRIDVICKQNYKHLMTNSKSYGGTIKKLEMIL